MFKLSFAALTCFGLLSLLVYYRLSPTTELVDASGLALTSGLEADAPTEELYGGGLFDEARALVDAGRWSEAETLLVPLLEATDRDGEACILLSIACRESKQVDEAVDWGLKAVELLPESGEAHHVYAKALALKMFEGNRLAAIPLLPRWRDEIAMAVQLDPSNVDARLEEITFYLYVPGFVGGDLEHARELCRELEVVDPVKGLLWRALAAKQADETDLAIELCTSGEREFPAERMFAATLGNLHAEAERYDEADACYERARTPPRGEAHYRALYSQANMRLEGDFEPERAAELYSEYIAAAPDYPMMPPVASAWWRKGRALEAQGELDEARAAFQRCLELEPDHDEARAALKGLPE